MIFPELRFYKYQKYISVENLAGKEFIKEKRVLIKRI